MQQATKSPLGKLLSCFVESLHENRIPFCSAVLFGLAAHMFAFSNKLVNADEIESLFGKGATVTSSRWGLELIKPLFPDASMPWLWGILSLLMLAAAAVLIVRIFQIKSPLMQILLPGMITCFPSQTGVFCFMFTSTPYALAFLLSVLSVWLFEQGGRRRIYAAAVLVISLSIYQAYIAVTAALLVLGVIRLCLDGEKAGTTLRYGFGALGMLLLALLLYAGISFLVFRISGTEFNDYVKDNVNQQSIPARIRMAYDFLYYTLSYREFALISGEVSRYMHLICMALCMVNLLGGGFAMLRDGRAMEALLMLFASALLPLAVYCMFLAMEKGSIHTLVLHSFVCFYVLAALLADRIMGGGSVGQRLGRDILYTALCIALAGNIYLANKCYLKLYLQYENAYSFYSVMLARVQGTEGYDEDCKLAMIGEQDNKLTRFPEIDLGYLMGPSRDLINIYSRENFIRRYMGSTIPLAGPEETEKLREREEFAQMAEYPYYGSVQKIDEYIVVKLG